MNSYGKDYRKLYLLQDKFLGWWSTMNLPFYLTGGTALGRYFLNHRYSEDLDFFVNNDPLYANYISKLKNTIGSIFSINEKDALYTEDFSRFFISEEDIFLKIELVNDVNYRTGEPLNMHFGLLDTPINILSNKLSSLVGRDEPKDVFDIVQIASKYTFNWATIFFESKKKTVLNEIDVEQRLCSFPLEFLNKVDWMIQPVDFNWFKNSLRVIADDFLLGKNNSLCTMKKPIEEALPIL